MELALVQNRKHVFGVFFECLDLVNKGRTSNFRGSFFGLVAQLCLRLVNLEALLVFLLRLGCITAMTCDM